MKDRPRGGILAREVDRAGHLDKTGKKPANVVVGLVDGEPSDGPSLVGEALQQLQHEGGFAPARRSLDQSEFRFFGARIPFVEPASGNRRREDWGSQLR